MEIEIKMEQHFLKETATLEATSTLSNHLHVTKKNQIQDQNNNFVNKNLDDLSIQLKKSDLNVPVLNGNEKFYSDIVWRNVIAFIILHVAAGYGVFIILYERAFFLHFISHIIGGCSGLGITAGAHRLWAHKAYKAKWQLRLILMIFQSLAFQNSIYEWVRDHRVHHKFTDTNADPHNSRRGFFFSHMGWLMTKKHPDVKKKGKTIDMSDLESDPIVMFQHRHYLILMPLCCFIVPPLIPHLIWNLPFRQCFFLCGVLRFVVTLHITWSVNSVAHLWGFRPYDSTINPRESPLVILIAQGEGYHNYHHVFPWDYKAAELGSYFFNFTKQFIDFFSLIGWAYDLKTVSRDMIRKRILRTGDGAQSLSLENQKIEELIAQLDHEKEEQMIWGWDDKDLKDDDRNDACIINKKE